MNGGQTTGWVRDWPMAGRFAALLCGLCLSACANTIGTRLPAPPASVQTVPPAAAPAAPAPEPAVPQPVLPPSVTLEPLPSAPAARVALLLPLHSATLGAAAQAVRDGVAAAHQREPQGITLDLRDSGDSTADLLAAYANAAAQSDLVIGPLARSAVNAVAQQSNVVRPTIALAQPPGQTGSGDILLPPQMLAVGLSLEDEAQQVARWIASTQPGATVFVLSSAVGWQQRAAHAFVVQARSSGLDARVMELSVAGATVSADALVQLRQRIAVEQPQAIFVALEAAQARQVRTAIGDEITLYGTSQLNPLALADWASAEPIDELNGARLVDIPWQLLADHPATMAYPQRALPADQRRSALQERLYALGIDAYRVAREILNGHSHVELDGVTGKLVIDFGTGAASFQRTEPEAVYRDGKVQPWPALSATPSAAPLRSLDVAPAVPPAVAPAAH